MAEWVLAAASRVGAWSTAIQPVTKELPVAPAVASECIQDIWRTAAVCFGVGEDFLKRRRFVEISIFSARFACGLIAVCVILAVVSLRDGVFALLARAVRRPVDRPRRSASSSVQAALDEFKAAGLWEGSAASTAQKKDEPARRKRRFAHRAPGRREQP